MCRSRSKQRFLIYRFYSHAIEAGLMTRRSRFLWLYEEAHLHANAGFDFRVLLAKSEFRIIADEIALEVKTIVPRLSDDVYARRIHLEECLSRAFSNLRQWADTNGFTILLQEQVWDGPFFENGGQQIVFRVVVQDRSGERKWARVSSGRRFEVRWTKPESSFATLASHDDPLWDEQLDA